MDVNRIKNALERAVENKSKKADAELRTKLMETMGGDLVSSLAPLLREIAKSSFDKQAMVKELVSAMKDLKIEMPEIKIPRMPEVIYPDINIPDVIVNYTPPEIKYNPPPVVVPKMQWPEGNMPIEGLVSLQGINLANPLPVQLRDASGKPVSLNFEEMSVLAGGGGGGRAIARIGGIDMSAWGQLLTGDGRLKTESASGSSGLTDTELRAAHVDIQQLSGSIDSVNIMETRGNPTPVGTGYQDNALRVVHATDAIMSVRVDGSSASVSATIVDSGGVGYSGSNPLPTTLVSSSVTSTIAVGPIAADTADDGSSPVQMGGIARQANPTAVAANDVVKATYDDVGRQLIRTVQVRDLIATAFVQITNGTETTLLAGVSSTFHDLIWLMAANNSDAAVSLSIRASTAGTVILNVQVPANGTAGISATVPYPQPAEGSWTVDMGDITGTTVSISALFSKEV